MSNIVIPAKFSNYKSVMKSIKKNGEKPNLTLVFKRLGVDLYQFSRPYKNKEPWALEIKKEYDKIRQHWEKNGGSEAKTLKTALINLQNRGEEPTLIAVCREAESSIMLLNRKSFQWSAHIYDEIMKANTKYFHGINNSFYDKCLSSLKELLKNKEFPTVYNVATKAGFSKDILTKNIFIWKQKIISAIENTRLGYEKINSLYIDVNTAIKKVVSEQLLDYRRIGITLTFSQSQEQHNLAHIMYAVHLVGVPGGGKKASIYVKEDSYDSERIYLIKGIIMACEGVSQKTINSQISYMIEAAIWMGNKLPKEINDAKQLFVDYSNKLKRIVKSGETTHKEARNKQQGLLKLLAGMFTSDVNNITKDNTNLLIPQDAPLSNAYSNTAKFTQKDLEYAFKFYYHLFKQLAEILLENKPLPQPIILPAGKAVVMGTGSTLIATKESTNASRDISYKDGHILSDEEIEAFAMKKAKDLKSSASTIKKDLFRIRKKSLKNLSEINAYSSHPKRLQLGKKALDAWFMCMLYFTSMNDSTLGTLEWGQDDELELEPETRKEFYNIKPRAMYQTVRFPLPRACINDFNQFLQLRRFVLDGKSMSKLFFMAGYGNTSRVTNKQFQGAFSATIKNAMQKIDRNLPGVTSRASRRDHARDALEENGADVALAVLQNSHNALIKNYNGQTAEEMATDISDFMDVIHNNAISDKPITKEQEHGIGGCEVEGKNEPSTIEGSPIEAKCDDLKSCIFCEFFKTFPEREFIRKLLSLKYVIENTAYDNAPTDDYYETNMNPWLNRIEFIFNLMREKEPTSKQMIQEITEEVNEGLLSPYWLIWSEIYEELGMFQ